MVFKMVKYGERHDTKYDAFGSADAYEEVFEFDFTMVMVMWSCRSKSCARNKEDWKRKGVMFTPASISAREWLPD